MVYIILFLIAIIFIAGVEPIARCVKVPFILFLIIFGVLFSKYGIYDFFGYLEDINSSVSELTVLTNFSIEILFLIAGLSLSLTNIKKTFKEACTLSFLPVLVECIAMGSIVYFLFSRFLYTIDITPTFFSSFLIMGMFAMSSSVIVVPIVIEAKENQKKNLILDQISFASTMDNFLLIPLLAICFTLIRVGNVSDLTFSGFEIVFNFFITVLTIIGAGVIGYLYGYLVAFLFNKFEQYDQLKTITTAIIIVLGSLIVINLTGMLGGMLGLVCAFSIGLAFDSRAKVKEVKIKAHRVVGKIYFNFFMPLIFLYIGVNLRLDLLLNIRNLLLILALVIGGCTIKLVVSSIYLKIKGYSLKERNVARTLFLAKGVMLFYFIPIFTPSFVELGLEPLLSFMAILATVSVILTIPLSTILSDKFIKKL